jgi:hypothetical protein
MSQTTFRRPRAHAGILPRSAACRPRLHEYADVGTITNSGIASLFARDVTKGHVEGRSPPVRAVVFSPLVD